MSITRENSMLVRVTIRSMCPNKKDENLSKEMQNAHKMERDAAFVIKNLLTNNDLAEINTAFAKVYKTKMTFTLPWQDGNIRLLPTKAFDLFTKELQEGISEVNQAINNMIAHYDEIKEKAKKRLNGSYREEEFPTIEKIQRSFGINISYLPVPEKSDFRITDESVLSSFEHNMKEQQQAAQQEIWERFREVIVHLHNRLAKCDKGFRQSIIDNINKVSELAKVLNMDEDKNIENFRKEVEQKFKDFDAEEFKEETVREAKLKETKDLLKKLDNYL